MKENVETDSVLCNTDEAMVNTSEEEFTESMRIPESFEDEEDWERQDKLMKQQELQMKDKFRKNRNKIIDTLTDDIYMITDYMAGEAFCYSGEFPGEEEKCEATIRGLLPLSLSSIPGACRRGFQDLCNQVFQACED